MTASPSPSGAPSGSTAHRSSAGSRAHVLVTGADGFLGRSVVAVLVQRGYRVTAMRRRLDGEATFDPAVEIVIGDLAQAGSWSTAVAGADVVVHAAAAMTGGFERQYDDTVVGTQNLLDALQNSPVVKLVHISSIAVHELGRSSIGATIDHSTPLDRRLRERGPYVASKIQQELRVRQWADRKQIACFILRPGAVIDRSQLWNYGAAARIGWFDFVIGPHHQFPVVTRDSCAAAVIAAVEHQVDGVMAFDLVADEPPTYVEFHEACRRHGLPVRRRVAIPWSVTRTAAALATNVAVLLPGAMRRRLPEALDRDRVWARWGPHSYSDDAAYSTLGWVPEDITAVLRGDSCG